MSNSTLASDLGKLLKNNKLSDVILVTSDKVKINAHKPILAVRCGPFSIKLMSLAPVKKKLPNPPNSPSNNTLTSNTPIPELEVPYVQNVTHRILQFIYTDEVALEGLSREDLFSLFIASKALELDRLYIICERYLCSNITTENIIPTLEKATKNGWKTIETYCYSFILQNYKDVVLLPGFSTLGSQLLVEIMKMHQLNPTGIQVPPLPDVPDSKLVEDLIELHTEKTFSDFTLTVQNQSYKTHTCILGARSEYFFNFDFNLETRTAAISMNGITPTPSAFDSFLKYLYTDSCDMSVDNAVYCITMNEFYKLTNARLKTECEKTIETKLSNSNALIALDAAERCKNQKLQENFVQFIVSSYAEIVRSSDLKKVRKVLLIEILQALAKK